MPCDEARSGSAIRAAGAAHDVHITVRQRRGLEQITIAPDLRRLIRNHPGLLDQPSFVLGFSSGLNMGLADPFPVGETPYFTLVDGFPVADGFFVSTSPFSPGGVPLEQDPINLNLDLGYTGDTLGSLDILDAEGTYDFGGLTRFGFNLWAISPSNVGMEIDFAQMTITALPVAVDASTWGRVKAMFE